MTLKNQEKENDTMMISRGDIYMARLAEDQDGGSLQEGVRPILVISNDKCNEHSPIITIVPFTTKLRKNPLPTHVVVEGCGLRTKSLVLAEQILSINKCRLERRLGSIRESQYEKKIDNAIKIQLNV